jgi:hypothetical protein
MAVESPFPDVSIPDKSLPEFVLDAYWTVAIRQRSSMLTPAVR